MSSFSLALYCKCEGPKTLSHNFLYFIIIDPGRILWAHYQSLTTLPTDGSTSAASKTPRLLRDFIPRRISRK